jgi:periplasmic divalent cation tolerance protein
LPRAAILVLTKLPDRESARMLARVLVGARLAACVSVGASVESLYHWRGEIEMAPEVPLTVKTTGDRYAEIEAAIRRVHPYELPEILAVPILHGLSPYLDWIDHETHATGGST